MQNVRDTVLDTLRVAGYGSYSQYAEPVITALEGREADICGVLIEYATQQGMSRTNVESALRQAGMNVPVPQDVPAPAPAAVPMQSTENTGDPVLDALREIQNSIAGLTAFARENGYRG